jgi:ADP-ribosylglycohydrolase
MYINKLSRQIELYRGFGMVQVIKKLQIRFGLVVMALAFFGAGWAQEAFKEVEPGSYQDHVYGAVLGAALGDALGRPTEFLATHEQIAKRYPAGLSHFGDFHRQDFWFLDGKDQAAFTDDTQMAMAVLDVFSQNWEVLNQYDFSPDTVNKVMTKLARRFVDWSIDPDGGQCVARAPGNACLRGCKELARLLKISDAQKTPHWWECGGGKPEQVAIEGGSGAVMRAWPIGLVLAWPLIDQIEMIEKLAVSQSKMTHRHPKSLAASAAIAVGVCQAVHSCQDTPVQIALEMINSAKKYDMGTANLMTWALEQAQNPKSDDKKILDRLQSWAADEAGAAAIYIFVKYPHDLAMALKVGANATGDSDTIATLAGALVGAYSGISSLRGFEQIEKLEKIEQLKELASNIYLKHYARISRFIMSPNEMVFGV